MSAYIETVEVLSKHYILVHNSVPQTSIVHENKENVNEENEEGNCMEK